MTAKHYLLSIGAAACMMFGAAYGHSMLESSSPANNAVLTAPPKSIDLTFGHPAKLVVLKLQKGNDVVPLAGEIPTASSKTFSIPLPVLTPGKYQAIWGNISEDGHPMKGTVSFTILGH